MQSFQRYSSPQNLLYSLWTIGYGLYRDKPPARDWTIQNKFFSTFLFNVVRASDKNEKFAELRDIRGGPSEMAKKYDNKLLV